MGYAQKLIIMVIEMSYAHCIGDHDAVVNTVKNSVESVQVLGKFP